MTNDKPPITAAQVSDAWIADCRQAINQRDGVPVRANPLRPQIDVYSVNRAMWQPLMLPGSGHLFVDFDERNLVLRRLVG